MLAARHLVSHPPLPTMRVNSCHMSSAILMTAMGVRSESRCWNRAFSRLALVSRHLATEGDLGVGRCRSASATTRSLAGQSESWQQLHYNQHSTGTVASSYIYLWRIADGKAVENCVQLYLREVDKRFAPVVGAVMVETTSCYEWSIVPARSRGD